MMFWLRRGAVRSKALPVQMQYAASVKHLAVPEDGYITNAQAY